jgi:bifunctional NMN adenylyltransferase/nudix hydrolase
MKIYDFAVIIGRFQPFHNGHLCLVDHAYSIAKHLIIVVGSHHAPISIRNPWDTIERELFIKTALDAYGPQNLTLIPLSDSAYNFNDWVIRVQQKVTTVAGSGTISIVGHYKDDTSYYLNHFPQWHLDSLPTQADGISATAIRNAVFENRLFEIKQHLPLAVYDELVKWTRGEVFLKLQEDYQFIQNYRKKWECAPYPPMFVTADAVVIGLGHVLLVKRKMNPGKGRYALPGGFVKQNESIENSCLRELKEETNIDLGYKELHGSIKLTHVFDHPLRDPRGRIITHAFMFELSIKELPKISAGDEALEALWFPLYKIERNESLFFNDHAQIIKFFINHTS